VGAPEAPHEVGWVAVADPLADLLYCQVGLDQQAPRLRPTAREAVRFNVLGLLDLVVAVSLAVLLGLPGLVAVTPSTDALRLLPLALVPTVPVPLAVALHIVSLHRLRTATRPEEDRAVHVPAAG
jgi:hypothetical protein